ncbi:MAG: radical SAM protein [Planctomycetota bacterium]
MKDSQPPSDAPRGPGPTLLPVWRLALPAAPRPLLLRRDRPFDTEAPSVDVADVLRYVATARVTLRGPLALEIEGPGDPLASAESTLRILSLLREHHPDVRVGLVIDGPLLGEYAEELADFGLAWLVVRLDAASQRVAERFFAGGIHRGEVLERPEAAALYLDEVAKAFEIARREAIATAARITLLPTWNDEEIAALAAQAARGGAQRVDVVGPAEGDVPALRGVMPTAGELDEARDIATHAFAEERHRVGRDDDTPLLDQLAPSRFRNVDLDALDAVDVLRTLPDPDEDAPREGAILPRRRAQVVAVATRDGTLVDLPLQQAHVLHVYAVGATAIRLLGTRELPAAPGRRSDGVGHAPRFLEALMGCRALVATDFAPRALTLLRAVGIRPIATGGRVDEVLDRVARGTLGAHARGV